MANKTLTFEIGTEELPAFDLHAATEKLGGLTADALDGAKIPHGDIAVYSTPRRLIVVALDVPEATEATEEEFRGPASKIAFDDSGAPTKAAIGFARGKGVDPTSLERRDETGTEYVYAVKETPSLDVSSLLPELLGIRVVLQIPDLGAPRVICGMQPLDSIFRWQHPPVTSDESCRFRFYL